MYIAVERRANTIYGVNERGKEVAKNERRYDERQNVETVIESSLW